MISTSRASILIPLAVVALAQEKLSLRYFHDKNDERLAISDIRFLTQQRAIAIATLIDTQNNKLRGAMLSSNDGGANWTLEPFKEVPRSLSFIDDSFGWMATENGVWHTSEGGRSWKKLKSQKGIIQIHFLDAQRGFAAGAPKLLLETRNGGKDWSPVAEAAKPDTKAEHSVYSVIAFATPKNGIVAGASIPPRPSFARRMPDWIEPEMAKLRAQRPTVLLSLETHDGGEKWSSATASIFGRPTRMVLAPGGGFFILQFDDAFQWPSEVYRMTGGGKTASVFREKDRRATDILIQKGIAYVAAVEPAAQVPGVPIPGKVHLLRSVAAPYTVWEKIAVDYRAIAGSVRLAQAPDGTIWAATDEGMILSLAR